MSIMEQAAQQQLEGSEHEREQVYRYLSMATHFDCGRCQIIRNGIDPLTWKIKYGGHYAYSKNKESFIPEHVTGDRSEFIFSDLDEAFATVEVIIAQDLK